MRFVVDANVVISAVLKMEGKTRDLIFLDEIELYSPDFLLGEIEKHKQSLIDKSGVSDEEFELAISILFSRIRFVSYEEFKDYIERAKEICPDPNDKEYFALAMAMNCPIWSDDTRLKEQEVIEVFSTPEMVGKFG